MSPIETKQNILAELLHDEAQQKEMQARHAEQHKAAVIAGNTEQAEKLEEEIDSTKRKQGRLAIQIEAARSALVDAEAADAKAKAAKATKNADVIADRAAAKLDALQPLAAQLEEIVGALSKDYDAWLVARILARQSGGMPKQYHGGPQATALFELIAGNGKKLGRIMAAFGAESVR